VPSKMQERLNNAKVAYTNLMKFKSDTKYKEKADQMLVQIEKKLQNFTK
jgi:outer membrane protein assembly factor BamD